MAAWLVFGGLGGKGEGGGGYNADAYVGAGRVHKKKGPMQFKTDAIFSSYIFIAIGLPIVGIQLFLFSR